MLKPSYAELMDVLNKNSDESNEITSRYTIVIAAAKRARQIIEGDEPMVTNKPGKPVSTAVDEILNDKIKVVPEGEGTVLCFEKDNIQPKKDDKDDIDLNDIEINDMDLNDIEVEKEDEE
ncbi:DNA-directed RNA polymerase subunit omega [uncultured Tyzzerella sp.]|uniref:DNA-directed RNA polymerase subunit omega n=1 Tax=uncultured Tyzzerella sp. TaxID=2321398 RepID=UPI0029429B33|nr:DNA-directed RNA polymerase subunit omega [uncultured Tyzzerella sp.]